MKRKQRTEILIQGSRDVAARLAHEILDRYEVSVLEEPHYGLVMAKMRETAKRSLFYLGEILVTECKVGIGDAVGIGILKGHDSERAYQMAVIDCAYHAGLKETEAWEDVLRAEETKIRDEQLSFRSQVLKTKVNFETMNDE